ncbi:MAG: GNAT family N-acetyltransferase [Oscillospiraceae bacterium]|nr:GNAT family N-acetyltransferase [Oscillospiraceae bacterium]
MPDIIIREAILSDINDLYELYANHLTNPASSPHKEKEQWDINKWSEMLQGLINDPDYHILIGEMDGKAVSSVTLIIIRNLTHNLRPYALIENVVTHGDFRNKGYASLLMDRAGEIAQSYGCFKIMLMTGSKKESTLKFYENCGFNRNDKTGFIKWL